MMDIRWDSLSTAQQRILLALTQSYGFSTFSSLKLKRHYPVRILGHLFPQSSEHKLEALRDACRDLETIGLLQILRNPYLAEDVELRLTSKGGSFLKTVSPNEVALSQKQAKSDDSLPEEEFHEDSSETRPDFIGEEDDPYLGTHEEWTFHDDDDDDHHDGDYDDGDDDYF